MKWLRPDEAALWLAVKRETLHVIAHREGWRKSRHGRDVRYAFEDVAATLDARLGRMEAKRDPGDRANGPGA